MAPPNRGQRGSQQTPDARPRGPPPQPRCGRGRLGDPARSPETELVDAEQRDELFAALARLKEEERTAIVARYFIGLTDEETAAALGVRRGAVKMRVFRALEHLREELGVVVDA